MARREAFGDGDDDDEDKETMKMMAAKAVATARERQRQRDREVATRDGLVPLERVAGSCCGAALWLRTGGMGCAGGRVGSRPCGWWRPDADKLT